MAIVQSRRETVLERSDDRRLDRHFPLGTGITPTPLDIVIATIPNITDIEAGSSYSENFAALYVSGSDASGAVLSLEILSGSLASTDLSFSSGTLSGATPDADGIFTAHLVVTKSGQTFLSPNPTGFTRGVVPAVTEPTDLTAPTSPYSVQVTSVTTTTASIAFTGCQDNVVIGEPQTNVTTYRAYLDGVLHQSFAAPVAGPAWALTMGAVGTVTPAPSMVQDGNDFSLTSAGASVGSASVPDSFGYAYVTVTGDCVITAQVDGYTSSLTDSLALLHLRQSLDTLAPFFQIGCWRTNGTKSINSACRSAQASAQALGVRQDNITSRPLSFKVTATSGTFASYYGLNSNSFTSHFTQVPTIAGSYLVGIGGISTTNGTEVTFPFKNLTITQLVPVTPTLTALTPGTSKLLTITAVDGEGNESAHSAPITLTTEAVSTPSIVWRSQSGSGYLSVLPQHTGPGMDQVGAARAVGERWVCYINSTANTNTATDITSGGPFNEASGTLEGCLKFNKPNKLYIFTTSGVFAANKQLVPVGTANALYGYFAPGQGILLKATKVLLNTSNWQVYGLRARVGGNSTGGSYAGNRDSFSVGGGFYGISNTVISDCEFGMAVDECFDGYSIGTNYTIQYCAFIEPLHVAGHVDYPAGVDHAMCAILGGAAAEVSGTGLFRRNFGAHYNQRFPLTRTRNMNIEENLAYNYGSPPGASPQGGSGQQLDHYNVPGAMTINVRNNVYIRGPNNTSNGHWISGSAGHDSATRCHVSGNAQWGWSALSSQQSFMTDNPPIYTSSLLTSILPPGHTTLDAWGSTLNLTNAEALAAVEKFRVSVGPNPGARNPNTDRVELCIQQAKNRINGSGDPGAAENTEAGYGYTTPTIPVVSNLTDVRARLAVHGANLHVAYSTGTFTNGVSRVGYTRFEAEMYEQRLLMGGQ